MRDLVQSTAANVMVFLADSTDHLSGKTGLTLTVTLSKNGAAFGAPSSGAVTERTLGWYSIALDTTDTGTVGDLVIHAAATGADPADRVCNVIASKPANVVSVAGTAQTARDLGAQLDATVSSRSTYAGGAVASVTGAVGSVTGNVGGNVAGSVASVTADVGITQAAADKVWGSAARTLTGFGTLVADIWANATRTLSAISDSSGVTTLLSRIVGTLAAGTHNPQTGDAYARLGSAGAGLTALGDARLAHLDADVSSRSTLTAGGVRTELATELGRIDFAVSTRLASSMYTAPTTPPTTAEIDSALTSSHGSGAWTGGGGSGSAPTVEEIDAALSSSHGSGEWGGGSATVDVSAIADAVDALLATHHGAGDWQTATEIAVVLKSLQGEIYARTLAAGADVRIMRGDSPVLPFSLGDDFSAWTPWFGAKESTGDTTYAIGPKECSWADGSTGKGAVVFTAAETDLPQGRYLAEVELRNGEQRLTPLRFTLVILADVVRDAAP